jgi:CheY-like chemotaxis protein
MNQINYDNVDILLVDPDVNSRQSIRMALNNSGFRKIRIGSLLSDLRKQITSSMPDLLICDCQLPDGNFFQFVRSLRHHDFGSNPFLPVICLTWNATPEVVTGLVASGADDLLSKPISTAQLLDRINTLVLARKPFVVTSDYVGPDRRIKSVREKDRAIPKVDVPNTLKIKATGEGDLAAVNRAIAEAIGAVNDFKLERHADQIGILVERIAPDLLEGICNAETNTSLHQLKFVADDTGRRMINTKYAHVSQLCDSLIKVTNAICASVTTGKPSFKDVRLLKPLSQAIRVGFESETHAAASAKMISAEIGADT